MLLIVLLLLSFNSFTWQEIPKKCQNSVCVPYSECPEARAMLKDDALLDETRSLFCGYAHEPFVCCKRDCKTPNDNYGKIVHINDCLHLKRNRYSSDRQKWSFLRESEINRTHVCCKLGEDGYIVVPPAPLVTQVPKMSCLTPNGEAGKCVEVDDCDAYREVVGEVDDKFRFVNDSYCGWWGRPMICCGSVHYYKEDFANNLPDEPDCGKWNGEDPQQNIPPWMVLIRQKGAVGGCVGALINEEYVLATTRCFANFTSPDIEIGECINDPSLTRCRFKPSKITTFPLHKFHKSEDTGLVLVKLNRAVPAPTAPVCLPSSVLPLSIDIDVLGLRPKGSAWTTFQTTTLSIENEICEKELKDFYVNRIVCVENGICEDLNRSLLQYLIVRYDNNRWYLEGLVNRERCYGRGNNLFHAVSVHKFVPWIKSNVS